MTQFIPLISMILGLIIGIILMSFINKRHYGLMLKNSNNDSLLEINSLRERLESREKDLSLSEINLKEQNAKLDSNIKLLQLTQTDNAVVVQKLQRIADLELDLDRSRTNEKQQQELINKFTAESSMLNTRLDEQAKQNNENLLQLEHTNTKMKIEFENLANKILDTQSKKFTEQNKENINLVLEPLRTQIGDFKKKVEDVYDKEAKDRHSLFLEINNLKSLNTKISEDAINLTNALKGESKKRGNWGEVILERVLESSGLKKGREYDAQDSFRDEHGKLYYPDIIVHLPDSKDVVIDSKVSLNAYDKYYSANNDIDRKTALDEHLNSIRNHIKDLGSKNYDELIGVNSLDMVLLFVPIEPALILAFENDENLFQDAFSKGIFLVSPSTLSMNLQIIHNMWRYDYQNQNAQDIAKKAGDLYDKFIGFVEALNDIGDKISKAQESYITANNRLIAGKGNLVTRTEALKQLGAKTKKSMPENLLKDIISDTQEISNLEELDCGSAE